MKIPMHQCCILRKTYGLLRLQQRKCKSNKERLLADPFAGDGVPLRTTALAGRTKPGNDSSNRWSLFRKREITRSPAHRQELLSGASIPPKLGQVPSTPFSSSPFSPIPDLPSPAITNIIQLGGLRERCKLPQRHPGLWLGRRHILMHFKPEIAVARQQRFTVLHQLV